jgi:hypothetical protein
MKEKVKEPTELESTDCGVVGREGVTLDVTGVGDEGSAVKLKSFTVVKCNGHELTFKEKTDIKFDKKLCCQTMNFCQSVIHTQFP